MDPHNNSRVSASPRLRTSTAAALTTAVGLASVITLAAPAWAGSQPLPTPEPVGAVYVMSNSWAGNDIITFPRLADGTLQSPLPAIPTGGLGSGPGAIPGVATDPLGSQGSLVVDAKDMRLFAVNAGSGSVSMFSIKPDGLTRLDTADTGTYPVSVAANGDAVYVLNAQSNSVTRFTVASNQLRQMQTCPLPAPPRPLDPPYLATDVHSEQPVATEVPGQIGVSPDGKHVLVVAKEGPVLAGFPLGDTAGNGQIHVFDTTSDGTVTNCDASTSYVMPENSPGHGKFPFSFAWTKGGQLLVTEVFGTGPGLFNSAVQPFTLNKDGTLTPISDPVGSGQIAVCWISVSGQNVYTTNYLTNDLSSYTLSGKSSLTLNDPAAGGASAGTLVTPIDQALSPDGAFLYQMSPGNGTIVPFAIDATNGALTQLASVSDGLGAATGQQGIATLDFQ